MKVSKGYARKKNNNTLTEMKNTFNGFLSRLNMAKKKDQ